MSITTIIVPRVEQPTRLPPQIISTPSPSFTDGTPGTYDIKQDVVSQLGTSSYVLSGSLASGLFFDSVIGVITYDGVGSTTSGPHQLTVTDAAGVAVSSNFNIVVQVVGSQAWSYVGIPYVTDMVPSAIMPTLPTGADIASFPYDPCTLPPPAHPGAWPSAQAVDYYYIDKFHGSATNTGNTYGYPDQPRLTIPASAWAAGVLYVEIHGNNNPWPGIGASPDYDFDEIIMTGVIGTSSQPVFWNGVDAPWLGWEIEISGSQHFIFNNIHMMGSPGNQRNARFKIFNGCKYVTFRNGTVRGDGVGGSALRTQVIDISGGESGTTINDFICIYNNDIHDAGDATQEFNRDIHGVRPSYWNRHVWIINNNIYNLQGDCMQVGNSAGSQPTTSNSRSHYVYFAGNNCHDTWENAIDVKSSYHVFVNGNTLYDTEAVLVLFNNDEGPLTGYQWVINNTIYRQSRPNRTGVRMSGDIAEQTNYLIGNLVRNCGIALIVSDHGGGSTMDEFVIQNTFTNNGSAVTDGRGWNRDITFSGNITYNSPNIHIEGGDWDEYLGTTRFNYHMSYNSDLSATNVSAFGFDFSTGLQIDVNPLFTAPGSNDFTLQAGSPALGAVTTLDPVFDLFSSMYGISIKFDINGNLIPDTNADMGAYQRV